jgi:hypothetical protein
MTNAVNTASRGTTSELAQLDDFFFDKPFVVSGVTLGEEDSSIRNSGKERIEDQ